MVEQREEQKHQILKQPPASRNALASFIARIPQKYIASAGKLLGMLAYTIDRRHQRIVRRNLEFAFPEWPRNHIRRLSKRVFQNVGITLLEICQIGCFSRKDILHKVRIRGKDNLLSAIKSQKGVILISAHLGNWEMAHLFFSCYLQKPLVLVARQIQSRVLDQWVYRLRTRFGNIIIDKKEALPKMARTLRQGKAVGLLIDQGTLRSEGVETLFFGKTVTATPAAAILARRYDTPVVPAFCIRGEDGRLTLTVEPPLVLKKTKELSDNIQVNTQIMNDAVERAIRTHPEQWFWFHKRWKRHYPHLYPEDLARRQRRKSKKKALLTDVSGDYFV